MHKGAAAMLIILLSGGSAMAQPFPYLFPAQVPPPKSVRATCVDDAPAVPAHTQPYEARFDFRDWNRTHLADENLTVTSQDGHSVVGVSCSAPVVLMQLPPGAYQATASVASGEVETQWLIVPARGAETPLTFVFAPPENPPGLLPAL